MEEQTTESQNAHVCKPCYVCKGGCGAKLNDEEYMAHETKVCGTENCSGKGQPFIMKDCCEESCPNC